MRAGFNGLGPFLSVGDFDIVVDFCVNSCIWSEGEEEQSANYLIGMSKFMIYI